HAGEYSVPSKILSYLCAGRPILLSAPPQNQASLLLQEHQTGLVSAPSQMKQFLQQATNLYQDSLLRRHFGHNARQYALKSFNIEKICDKINLILNSLGN
ncbi:MAG: glycosyltransferase WbuB, partial [Bacteroidetes bacterium]|nr:glycosyltransferase WbuB [Bacteroidota bacterium]